MTMTDDQRLADQLRAVFDEHSAGVAPLVDRRAAVARRVIRHQRVRTLSALAALLVVAGSIAGVLGVRDHRSGVVVPAVTPSPTTAPGRLPTYQNGSILIASATIDGSRQSSGSLTFTPDSWDMVLGESCAVPNSDFWLVPKVNGHSFGGTSCGGGGGGTGGGSFGQHEQFWRDLGVELGVPSTITFQVGTRKTGQKDLTVTPRLSSGLVSVGVYDPVPFDQYPLDPKPSDWSPTDSTHFEVEPGMHQIGQVGELGKSDAERGDLTVPLPKHLTMLVRVNAPGIVTVFINGTPVFDCGSYGWGMGCESGPVAVGTEQLAGLKTGQLATISVQTQHFTEPNAVEVLVYGD